MAVNIKLIAGFGIDQLRDDCMDTYWQSDGQLPHLVNIQFQRKTMVSHIYIYTDYKLDESYTPSRISIRAGTHFNDLQEIEVIELIEPSGEKKMNFLIFIACILKTIILISSSLFYICRLGDDTNKGHPRATNQNIYDSNSSTEQSSKWQRYPYEAD